MLTRHFQCAPKPTQTPVVRREPWGKLYRHVHAELARALERSEGPAT